MNTSTPPEALHHKLFGPLVSGATTSAIGAAGIGVGLAGLFGTLPAVRIGWLIPLLGAQLRVEPVGGFFMVLTGAVALAAGLYWIGYARH